MEIDLTTPFYSTVATISATLLIAAAVAMRELRGELRRPGWRRGVGLLGVAFGVVLPSSTLILSVFQLAPSSEGLRALLVRE